MKEEYYIWLLNKVGFKRRGYDRLMRCLYKIPFEYTINRDRNRVDDARELYFEFADENRLERDKRHLPSVLEVLIALAIRIDTEYIGDPSDPDPECIFWEMCCNLGLEKYTDTKYIEDAVTSIIEAWLFRDFDMDGEGSIFPLKDPAHNQRNAEIWSQMQEYLSENY